ncbi:MAG: hypothetical protein ABSD92_04655 [Candidatus Bathyarchaeia archaeon]
MTVNISDSSLTPENEAAEALDNYIRKLEKRNVEGLTEKQIYSLIKTAKVLHTAIAQSKSQSERSRTQLQTQ